MIAPSKKKRFRGSKRTQFGYDATVDKGRRQPPKARTSSGDFELPPRTRSKLVATARDQIQNLSLVAWMVRKHVAYVSQFTLLAKTGSDELDGALERRFKNAATRDQFDIAGRHSLRSAMYVNETGKAVDGQAFIAAIRGGFCQLLESDLIARPDDLPKKWVEKVDAHGLVKDQYGKVLQYCRCKWDADGRKLMFSGMVKRNDMLADSGTFLRPSQTRGISPISAALNTFRDLYEGWEWTLLKIKVHSLCGVAIKRDALTDGIPTTAYPDSDIDTEGEETADNRTAMEVKDGLMQFDLDPGEDVDLIESKTPNTAVIPYSEMMIRAALLAFDIPYTAYDSRGTSFSAVMADRAEYEKAVSVKREDNVDFLNKWAAWKLATFVDESPALDRLISAAGLTLADVADRLEWVPDGTPWMDRGKEIKADADAVALGTDSRQRQCKRRGLDFYKLATERSEEEQFMRDNGVTYTVGNPGSETPADPNAEDTENE